MQNVLFEKGPGQKETPWHRDSEFWRFEGIGALTAWIPLQVTPLSMGSLRYAARSHQVPGAERPHPLRATVIRLRYRVNSSALALGDVTLHHYRTLHGAARNHEPRPRRALAIHLIDGDARYRSPRCENELEHATRCGWTQLSDGDPLPDEIAPLIYVTALSARARPF